LKENVAATVYKTENTAVGIRCADHAKPSIRDGESDYMKTISFSKMALLHAVS
jgi:hypothetical protein